MTDNKLHKKLLKDFIAESKITDRLETWPISSIIWGTTTKLDDTLKKSIVSMVSPKEITKNKFSYYLENLLPAKKQSYHPELSDMLYRLEEYKEQEDFWKMYILARKIFTSHKDILSFHTASTILLILAEDYIHDNKYIDAMALLWGIQVHEKHLIWEEKIHFLYSLSTCLYMEGITTNNKKFLNDAINYTYQLLSYRKLDKNIYKEALSIQISSLYTLWDHEWCSLAIKEFFTIFPMNTNKDDILTSNILRIKLLVDKSLKRSPEQE